MEGSTQSMPKIERQKSSWATVLNGEGNSKLLGLLTDKVKSRCKGSGTSSGRSNLVVLLASSTGSKCALSKTNKIKSKQAMPKVKKERSIHKGL